MPKYVAEDLDGRIDMILDGGEIEIGLESTIVDLTEEVPMILRPGYITKEMLESVLGEVRVDRTVLDGNSGQPPKAPGMKYRHYAPKGELTIIDGRQEQVVEEINRRAREMQEKGERVGVIGTAETVGRYMADSVKSAGSRDDGKTVAKSLYRILREFDEEGMTVIYSENFGTAGEEGIGQAVRNRLLKAAGHHIDYL